MKESSTDVIVGHLKAVQLGYWYLRRGCDLADNSVCINNERSERRPKIWRETHSFSSRERAAETGDGHRPVAWTRGNKINYKSPQINAWVDRSLSEFVTPWEKDINGHQ